MSQYRNKTQLMFRILVPIALALLLLISGCAAHSLREAQDSFAEGVRLEQEQNEQFYYTEVPSEQINFLLKNSIGPAEQYNNAIMVINNLLKDDKESLKQNNLLGTTYVLKALCIWKLNQDGKRIGELETVIKEAQKYALSDQQKTILEILPALNASDQKFYQIKKFSGPGKNSTIGEFNKIISPIFYSENSISQQLNATIAKESLPQLKLYLQEAKLTLYAHYHTAYNTLIYKLKYLLDKEKSKTKKKEIQSQLNALATENTKLNKRYKSDWDSYRTTMSSLENKSAALERLKFRRIKLIESCEECDKFLKVEILTPRKVAPLRLTTKRRFKIDAQLK